MRFLIHDPGVPVVPRAAGHQVGGGSVNEPADRTVRGALVAAVELVEDLI
jgi:FAD/FMN-containing dehydrogenase